MSSVLIAQDARTVIQLLGGSDATCGGSPSAALAQCPQASFCSTAAGDICVIEPGQVGLFTRDTPLASVVGIDSAQPAAHAASGSTPVAGPVALLSGLGLVLIGVAIGWMLKRR